VVANGLKLEGRGAFGPDPIGRGVVLEINKTVVLLLHYVAPVPADTKSDLGLLGDSQVMTQLRTDILKVAPTDTPVLLRGESGTGKELVARAIHAFSSRRDGTLVSVNMAAVPANLAESELFGYDKGAFSGADRPQKGIFRSADGGSLFLDEIGDTPSEVQTALLRALEEGKVKPLGRSTAESVDVRYLAATDVQLEMAVAAGAFKNALIDRLGGIELVLAPLRQRKDDIPQLLLHFLRTHLGSDSSLLESDAEKPWITASLMADLARYQWPRNVRQLKNVAQEMAVLCASQPFKPGPKVKRILDELSQATPAAPAPVLTESTGRKSYRSVDDVIRQEAIDALRANVYVVSKAATVLGLSQQSMYRLLDKHEIMYAKKLSEEDFVKHLEACDGDIGQMAEMLEISKRGLLQRKRDLGL
jgi:two-component system nitrogen regulation response regulator GlnG